MAFATVAKKAVEVLASNRKGRHFILYVIGIAIFILLIPLIMLLGLFGWTKVDNGNVLDLSGAGENFTQGIYEHFSLYDGILLDIETKFSDSGFQKEDISKAQIIFVSKLTEHSDDEDFITKYLECFVEASSDDHLFSLLENTFNITFTDEDKKIVSQIYGEPEIVQGDLSNEKN